MIGLEGCFVYTFTTGSNGKQGAVNRLGCVVHAGSFSCLKSGEIIVSETGSEKYSRVQQMILDKGDTWDLSPNDVDALRHVLGMVNVLADRLAAYMGSTVPDVLSRAHEVVEEETIG